jgi:simple sugar transport system permease protein
VLATAFVAVFFGGLAAAGLYLPVLAGLPAAAIDIINAAIALFITARAWPQRLAGFARFRRSSA